MMCNPFVGIIRIVRIVCGCDSGSCTVIRDCKDITVIHEFAGIDLPEHRILLRILNIRSVGVILGCCILSLRVTAQ